MDSGIGIELSVCVSDTQTTFSCRFPQLPSLVTSRLEYLKNNSKNKKKWKKYSLQ